MLTRSSQFVNDRRCGKRQYLNHRQNDEKVVGYTNAVIAKRTTAFGADVKSESCRLTGANVMACKKPVMLPKSSISNNRLSTVGATAPDVENIGFVMLPAPQHGVASRREQSQAAWSISLANGTIIRGRFIARCASGSSSQRQALGGINFR